MRAAVLAGAKNQTEFKKTIESGVSICVKF
jgi:hypothetical protein